MFFLLKEELVILFNNKEVVLNWFGKLKRRFINDSRYRKDYFIFMKDIIERGYVEKVFVEEVLLKDGCVWYIFYYGVYYLKKLEKIRVVFDCSVEFVGEFFNWYFF